MQLFCPCTYATIQNLQMLWLILIINWKSTEKI